MSLVWTEGFENYGSTAAMLSGGWTTSPGLFQAGRFGGIAFRVGQVLNAVTYCNLPGNYSRLIFGMALSFNSSSSMSQLMEFCNGGTVHLGFRPNNDALIVYHGSGTTLLNIPNFFIPGSYSYIELDMTIHDTSGSITVYKDGAFVTTITNVDTKNVSNPYINRIQIRWLDVGGNPYFYIDDMYAVDPLDGVGLVTPIYDARIIALRPVADTAQKDWTPNGGSANYDRVDEASEDADSTYVYDSTPGHTDLYELADLPNNPTHIHAVSLIHCSCKDDAGTRTIRGKLKSGSTLANGTEVNLGTGYAMFRDIWALNPDGNVQWTKSAVDALQAGIEMVS